MRAGRLRKRMVLQRLQPSTDSEGAPTSTWVTVGSVWAGITPTGGAEALEGAQEEARMTHQITLRYRTDVTHNSRLLLGSRVFDIQTTANLDERNTEMDVLAIERQR